MENDDYYLEIFEVESDGIYDTSKATCYITCEKGVKKFAPEVDKADYSTVEPCW